VNEDIHIIPHVQVFLVRRRPLRLLRSIRVRLVVCCDCRKPGAVVPRVPKDCRSNEIGNKPAFFAELDRHDWVPQHRDEQVSKSPSCHLRRVSRIPVGEIQREPRYEPAKQDIKAVRQRQDCQKQGADRHQQQIVFHDFPRKRQEFIKLEKLVGKRAPNSFGVQLCRPIDLMIRTEQEMSTHEICHYRQRPPSRLVFCVRG